MLVTIIFETLREGPCHEDVGVLKQFCAEGNY